MTFDWPVTTTAAPRCPTCGREMRAWVCRDGVWQIECWECLRDALVTGTEETEEKE